MVNTMKFGIKNSVFESVLSLVSDLGQVTILNFDKKMADNFQKLLNDIAML